MVHHPCSNVMAATNRVPPAVKSEVFPPAPLDSTLERRLGRLKAACSQQPPEYPDWPSMFRLLRAYCETRGSLEGAGHLHRYVKQWLDQQIRAHRAAEDARRGYDRRWHGRITKEQVRKLESLGFEFGDYEPKQDAVRIAPNKRKALTAEPGTKRCRPTDGGDKQEHQSKELVATAAAEVLAGPQVLAQALELVNECYTWVAAEKQRAERTARDLQGHGRNIAHLRAMLRALIVASK